MLSCILDNLILIEFYAIEMNISGAINSLIFDIMFYFAFHLCQKAIQLAHDICAICEADATVDFWSSIITVLRHF